MPTTSRFIRYFQTSTGVPLVGAALWLVPQANTYPTNALALSQHETRDGMYYRNAVPDGEYKIYISVTGSPAEGSVEMYEQNIWVGENKLSIIGQHFDANDSHRLTTNGIQDAAVTNTKIASYAVTEVSLADDAVTSRVLADEAVGSDQLAEEAVTTVKVADYAITTEKIDFDAVTGNQINDGAVTGGKIAPDSVNRSHIVAGEIVNEHYADGSITGNKIAAGAISGSQLDTECVSGDKIALSTITGQHLADEAVTNTKIAAYAVSEVSLADDAVTSRVIADEAVETNHLSDGSVSGSKLQNASVSTQHLVNGAVSATKLLNGNDYLKVSNGGAGVDGTPRQVSGSAAYVSQGKLQVRPGTNGDTFEVLDASGNVLLAVNTSAKTIDAKSGVKFTGDGSLLTGIVSTGTTGGTSSLTNIEIQADSDANGSGDIIFRIGSKVVARIPNAYSAGLAAGVEGSYFINSAVNTIYNGWGVPPSAYLMDGVDDISSVGVLPDVHKATDVTIECFFQLATAPTDNIAIVSNGVGYSTGYRLFITSTGNIRIGWGDGSNSRTMTSNSTITTGMYHVIVTLNSTSLEAKMYINGGLDKTEAMTSGVSFTGTTQGLMVIGKAQDGINGTSPRTHFFVRLHNWAYTAAQVLASWSNGYPCAYRVPFPERNANNTSLVSGDNSTFASDTGFWTKGANWAISGGVATATNANVTTLSAGILTLRKMYRIKFTISSYSGTGDCGIPTGRFTDIIMIRGSSLRISGTGTIEFIGISAGTILDFYGRSTNVVSIDNVTCIPVGCCGEWLAENAGSNTWYDTMNEVHLTTGGSPLTSQRGIAKDYRDGITSRSSNWAPTGIVPKGYLLKRIILRNTSENSMVINVGSSTSGGTDVVNASTVAGNSIVTIEINKLFSFSADQNLYFQSGAWQTLNIRLIMERQ